MKQPLETHYFYKIIILSYSKRTQMVLFVTQEKSFDIGSTDPRGSLKVVNLWLETNVFQLRKH
jgi:hypothetical protein